MSWRLDEIASAGSENLDPDHVRRYDAKEDARADDEVDLLRQVGLDERSVVVDLGAGTGQFAVAAARVCARVIAVDVSPPMLAELRAKVAASGLENIEVHEGGFLSYRHTGEPADIVYSRWALHHVPDFWKVGALARIHAMLRPGGLLRLSDIVYSFDPSGADRHLQRWRDTLPEHAPPGEWTRQDIDDHIRDEHSTYAWLLESMLDRTGFDIERADYSDDQIFADYLARARE